jgi:hypothetical protein
MFLMHIYPYECISVFSCKKISVFDISISLSRVQDGEYIYIYIYIYIYVFYLFVYMSMYLHIYIYMCIYVYMYTSMDMSTYNTDYDVVIYMGQLGVLMDKTVYCFYHVIIIQMFKYKH